MIITLSKSAQATEKIGKEFASTIKGGDILCLYGELGYGKTTFLQGLAKGLGIQKRIISPTFVIIRTYELTGKTFYHIDLYRIQSTQDLEGLGILEIVNDKNAIVAIEWPEKMENLLHQKRIDIRFEYIDENTRKITIINEK